AWRGRASTSGPLSEVGRLARKALELARVARDTAGRDGPTHPRLLRRQAFVARAGLDPAGQQTQGIAARGPASPLVRVGKAHPRGAGTGTPSLACSGRPRMK